ncbi:isopenicillin N synthase family oxygenase [Octadecabacter sp. G9-8]|uniref:2-oxoglutarate-dependent ethylene/succinate-forming enzyme n=1 Tax=Octadecabacter dasysiphoniae TaxID=2909341 RepID=A0ABS9CZ44_9RHOB|nr:2-oxoglutarate and iron-dependent oxygenase domain-containing protein [Octadecabacter dasysiphoniae]MCF2872062.1 isopenicillin N synthase family oxygenase [Octadecabacter dasysiphoniae]
MTDFNEQTVTNGDHLPLISIEKLRHPNTPQFLQTADQIGNAARTAGFFRICDHGISPESIEETYAAAATFFAQSDATKRRYYIGNSSNHRGYVPFTEKGDYPDEANRSYEAFDLGLDLPRNDPDYLAGNRVLGPNVWPALPGFKRAVAGYYAKVSMLGRLICTALEAHLRLPAGAMTQQMTKPISQLRLLHYVRQAATKVHTSVNMGAHTDYECLTLLHTRNKGLQVMKQDNQWVDVPVDPTVLIVNIGDMLEAWSNGIFRSTPHRVLNLSPERFSLPYFVAANHDTVIKPFPQLVRDDETPKYAPFLAGEHLETMLMRDFPYLRHKTSATKKTMSKRSKAPVQNPFETRLKQSVP